MRVKESEAGKKGESTGDGIILQARILEGVAISFSRGSSWPRDQPCVFCIACRLFTSRATGKPDALLIWSLLNEIKDQISETEFSLYYIIWTLELSVESRNKMYLLFSVSHWPVLSYRKLTFALILWRFHLWASLRHVRCACVKKVWVHPEDAWAFGTCWTLTEQLK